MENFNTEYNFNPEDLEKFRMFHPHAYKRTFDAITRGTRFVHYTSADSALKIINGNHVWARSISTMNDYMEIQYGLDCLNKSLKENYSEIDGIFAEFHEGIVEETINMFNEWMPSFRSSTYMTCISEHDKSEDLIGRLSMWRAYANVNGVAIVMNGGVFLRPSDALGAYTSPVAYLNQEQFNDEFRKNLEILKLEKEKIATYDRDDVRNHLFNAFRFAIFCTKHPGFHEEREWRIIYSPIFQKSDKITESIQCISGIPQIICEIPLEDEESKGLYGLNIKDLLERIIIGPTQQPAEIYKAFKTILEERGVENAHSKIVISDIPLRC